MEIAFNYTIGMGIFLYALSSPFLILLQFFLTNIIIPTTAIIITITNIIAPIIIAFANVVNTEPTVLIAVVEIAVISAPTTSEVELDSIRFCFSA